MNFCCWDYMPKPLDVYIISPCIEYIPFYYSVLNFRPISNYMRN